MIADRKMASARRADAVLAIVALSTLLVCGYYIAAFVFQVPYSGIDIDGSWNVLSFDDACDSDPSWCEANEGTLLVGDRLTEIGDLTPEEFARDRTRMPFFGFQAGDEVPIEYVRDGQTFEGEWQMLTPTFGPRAVRMSGLLLFLPFWASGTAVLLFLRPRDLRWALLIGFNYISAFWLTSGSVSTYRVAGSAQMLGASTCLMLPIYLHLHLQVPVPLQPRLQRMVFYPLYALAAVLAISQIWNPLAGSIYDLSLLAALVGSVIILLLRLAGPQTSSDRLTTRLMMAGILLAFGPGILLWLLPRFFQSLNASLVSINLLTLAISVQPFSYVYALYKRRLGDLEFRANRVLSLYIFLMLFITAFIAIFMIGSEVVSMSADGVVFALVISVIFVMAAIFLRAPFQAFIDRLAYGTSHNPDDILRTFANEIPRAHNRDDLVRLLTHEVGPSLLIRQSAIYTLVDGCSSLLYADRITLDAETDVTEELMELLSFAGTYRPPEPNAVGRFAWVRLVLRIEMRDELLGVWLLGKRDPDDYYPKPDRDLLISLAGQVGVALETMRLLGDLERRAFELERAYRDLQNLDKLKDEFVQNVSHELRTPLTFVRGYTDLLLEGVLGDLNPDQHDALATIADRTEGIVRLVNDIISIQQAALEKLERTPVNLVALARSCIDSAKMVAQAEYQDGRAYELVLQASEALPQVTGDRRRLNQVIDNLLNNAMKFSPLGGRIVVTCQACMYDFRSVDESRGLEPAVQVDVQDFGTGIPADQLARIWERFYQVDGSSTRRFGGMGLGLAIVREIIHAHGGVIWVDSVEGEGSNFHFVLPSAEVPEESISAHPSLFCDTNELPDSSM